MVWLDWLIWCDLIYIDLVDYIRTDWLNRLIWSYWFDLNDLIWLNAQGAVIWYIWPFSGWFDLIWLILPDWFDRSIIWHLPTKLAELALKPQAVDKVSLSIYPFIYLSMYPSIRLSTYLQILEASERSAPPQSKSSDRAIIKSSNNNGMSVEWDCDCKKLSWARNYLQSRQAPNSVRKR